MFFSFFKLYKWYQLAQRTAIIVFIFFCKVHYFSHQFSICRSCVSSYWLLSYKCDSNGPILSVIKRIIHDANLNLLISWSYFNEEARSTTRNFAISEVRNLCPYFWVTLKSVIWTFLFHNKNVREKVNFFINSKGHYYLLDLRTDIIFALFWDF